MLDEVIERGERDLVSDIAGKLALRDGRVMGLPREDAVEMYEASDLIINSKTRLKERARDGSDGEAREYSHASGLGGPARLPARGHADPDGPRRLDGWPVDAHQFALDFMLIFNAGGETTRNVVSGGWPALFAHRDQWALLAADTPGSPAASRRCAGGVTPIVYQRRAVPVSTRKIGGQPIPAGRRSRPCLARPTGTLPSSPTRSLRRPARAEPHMAFGLRSPLLPRLTSGPAGASP